MFNPPPPFFFFFCNLFFFQAEKVCESLKKKDAQICELQYGTIPLPRPFVPMHAVETFGFGGDLTAEFRLYATAGVLGFSQAQVCLVSRARACRATPMVPMSINRVY